jgi:hypothetical protein
VMVTHDNDLAKRVTRAVLVQDGAIVQEIVNSRPKAVENESGVERETSAPLSKGNGYVQPKPTLA